MDSMERMLHLHKNRLIFTHLEDIVCEIGRRDMDEGWEAFMKTNSEYVVEERKKTMFIGFVIMMRDGTMDPSFVLGNILEGNHDMEIAYEKFSEFLNDNGVPAIPAEKIRLILLESLWWNFFYKNRRSEVIYMNGDIEETPEELKAVENDIYNARRAYNIYKEEMLLNEQVDLILKAIPEKIPDVKQFKHEMLARFDDVTRYV